MIKKIRQAIIMAVLETPRLVAPGIDLREAEVVNPEPTATATVETRGSDGCRQRVLPEIPVVGAQSCGR